MPGPKRPNNCARILDAARRIVEERGTARLTIEAVATEAKLSKGGVIYHYGSKRALLEALRDEALADMGARFAEQRADHADGALAAWLRAHHASTAAPPALGAAVFANAAEAPEMLDPVRKFMRESLAQVLDEAGDPELARLLFIATVGIRLNEMFDLIGFAPGEQDRLEARLVELAADLRR